MIVQNKWNGKIYTVISIGNTVKLRRQDNTEFEIQKSEYHFNYREVKHD